jgi:hypothetical protein
MDGREGEANVVEIGGQNDELGGYGPTKSVA